MFTKNKIDIEKLYEGGLNTSQLSAADQARHDRRDAKQHKVSKVCCCFELDNLMTLVGYCIALSFGANVLGFWLGSNTIRDMDSHDTDAHDKTLPNTTLIKICAAAFLIPTFYASVVYIMWMN